MKRSSRGKNPARLAGLLLVTALLLPGCSSSHYRKSADREVNTIIQQGQTHVFGQTNQFNVETQYSDRDPQEIKAEEIIGERARSEQQLLTVSNALSKAVAHSRAYQFEKERLFTTALTLSEVRYLFGPRFTVSSSALTYERLPNQSERLGVGTQLSLAQTLRSGGRLGVTLANDLLRFHAGSGQNTAISTLSVNLFQPLLRGAGALAAAENLTQAERNVIYAIRRFSRYQNTFAVDIVTAYFRLLQQKDTVRNEYSTYRNLVRSRERATALAQDRLPQFQVDQARQNELRARNRYIAAIERYQDSIDGFKTTLGLPLGDTIQLDDNAMTELNEIGLPSIDLDDIQGYQIAVEKRLDLINQIDTFEDRKRQILVAANFLRTELNIFGNASLQSRGPTDYSRFDANDYRALAGVELVLPLDRLRERNDYRFAFIEFERSLRDLSLALDNVLDNVRQGLRGLELARQSYEIQRVSVELANRRVESAELLVQAGRAEIRDLLEAQDAQLQARNAFTQALIDYLAARLGLLRDLGVLNTDQPAFWLKPQSLPKNTAPRPAAPSDEVVTPDQLFGNK